MKLALFAAGNVGFETAQFLNESNEPPACLIIDSNGSKTLNDEIVAASGTPSERVYESSTIYRPEHLSSLNDLDIDLFLLSWWPYILKKELLRIPRTGSLNFHPSLLPHNRGKHYNFWTLMEDSPFGVTIHFVDEGVDSGDIAFQSIIDKSWEDTGETLYRKAQQEIVRLFKDNYPVIHSGHIPRRAQNRTEGSFHLGKELDSASQIDLDKRYTGRELLNLLRARTFPPHPGAWFIDGNEKYEARISIRRVDSEPTNSEDKPGNKP